MIADDSYKTIKSLSHGIYKEKGSKFIAYASPVSLIEEIKPILDDYRKRFYDAKHHSYAYLLGYERSVWRAYDDGEPSGTAGKPILGQINSFGLTNILIVVVRYFGGTLLGTSGLVNAYKTAAYEAISRAGIIECTVKNYYKIEFDYPLMNIVMKILKDEKIDQSEQNFGLNCSINISFRLSATENILKRFSGPEKIKLTFIGTH